MTQFYMKLEEKMHAKEAEVNQHQAKTQVCQSSDHVLMSV